jgi:hypothetical protein
MTFVFFRANHLYWFYEGPLESPNQTLSEGPMTGMPMNWANELERPKDKPAGAEISLRLRIAGAALRTIFILAILVIIVEVSLPQSETIWTAYDTPGDLVRMALGLGVGIWIAVQLFIMPKDAQGYRTWLYLGIVGVPFALICAAALWWSYLKV